MFDYTGWIVRATAGRDKNGIFCVVGTDAERFLLLADGKRRKIARPKRKKLGHMVGLSDPVHTYAHSTIAKLKQGMPVSDRELRRALAAFKGEMTLGEGRYD